MNDVEEVLSLNTKFYEAFAAGDFFAMQYLWAKQHEVAVIHPGWPMLHGYEKVMKSWNSIFQAEGPINIKCMDEKAVMMSSSAFVICSELLDNTKLVATNIFVREEGVWKIIHHQATVVQEEENVSDVVMH